jgi:hypothetical protein
MEWMENSIGVRDCTKHRIGGMSFDMAFLGRKAKAQNGACVLWKASVALLNHA